MPLYEYQCDACGHRFEAIQKFSDPPVETCPKCGSHVHKLIVSPAFHFKGSGWYITDYAKKDPAPASATEATKKEGSKEGPKEGSKEASSDAAQAKAEASPKTETAKPATKTDQA